MKSEAEYCLHISNTSIWKAGAGEPQVWNKPEPNSENLSLNSKTDEIYTKENTA